MEVQRYGTQNIQAESLPRRQRRTERRNSHADFLARPLMVRQPYSVAVLSTEGRLHPRFLRKRGLGRKWSSFWLKGDGGIQKCIPSNHPITYQRYKKAIAIHPVISAIYPMVTGATAPPTIVMISKEEASLFFVPASLNAKEKMVGNMMLSPK